MFSETNLPPQGRKRSYLLSKDKSMDKIIGYKNSSGIYSVRTIQLEWENVMQMSAMLVCVSNK